MSRLFVIACVALLQPIWASAAPATQPVINSIGQQLSLIPAGEFDMGSPADQKGHEDDEAMHRVKITRAFRMGAAEVTQAQWLKVMGRKAGNFDGGNLPVEGISWADAVAFCKKLSEMEGKTYRLPTEAEWEYACRAGGTGRFAGDKLDDLAWYDDNSDAQPHPAGSKKPNAWGLLDMHGNVAEWCADWYGPYAAGESSDPAGPPAGKARVVRGGSFSSFERGCRCASRSSLSPAYQLKNVGFRIVMEQ